MPIHDREKKQKNIVKIVNKGLEEFNTSYGNGPHLYFYRKVLALRKQKSSIRRFIRNDYCLEMLYAALVSWDMNSRGARMHNFKTFCKNIRKTQKQLIKIEKAIPKFRIRNMNNDIINEIIELLLNAYDNLLLMDSEAQMVSNSKCLHFLFPKVCIPMDRKNTMQKLYDNSGVSRNKFVEVLRFGYEILSQIGSPNHFQDNKWNTCPTKLVDNAIILLPKKNSLIMIKNIDPQSII